MRLVKCPRCWGLGLEPPALQAPCSYCQALQHIEDYNLSEHFTFGECVHAYEGCPNDPDANDLERTRLTLRVLAEPARAVVGALRVTSGYRCPQIDVLADGGNTHWLTHLSAHAIGSALDLQPLDRYVTLRMLLKVLVKHALEPWDQLIAEGGCVHTAAEGPINHGQAKGLPGQGARRKQVLIRRLRTKDDPPGWKYIYDPFNDTDAQWLKVV